MSIGGAHRQGVETRPPAERICVTGIGAVTPLGVGAQSFHDRWAAGRCAGENGVARCTEFVPEQIFTRKQLRRLDRFAQLALCSTNEALAQAGWIEEQPVPSHRIGCVIGTGGGAMTSLEEIYDLYRGPSRYLPPIAPTMTMANAACAAITLAHRLRGESYGIVAACAAGAQAIGAAMRLLANGELDAVIAGGSEATTTDWAYQSFLDTGALSPTGVARPFDRNRDGFVLGEGAGVLVLERGVVAERRGATVLAEALGFGASSDAFHITAPDPKGDGAARAIENALAAAGITAAAIDYVNAHGTGTRLNDPIETMALKRALGTRAYDIPISAPKSVIGHLVGGAGAVEAVATITALRQRVAPPTMNLEEPDDGLDLDYVPLKARPLPSIGERPRLTAISNSFAFGGHNAVLVFAHDG